MKLLFRITIAIICIVFSTGLILTSYSLSVQKTLITSQLDKKGRVLASVLATSVMSHLISYDFYTIKLLFEPLELDDDIVSVSLIGADNIIKMHSDIGKVGSFSDYTFREEDFQNESILKKEVHADNRHQYLFFSPVDIDHKRNGLIQVTLSDNESIQLINDFGQRILLLTAAVLLVGIIAAYLISRQISNPVIALTEEIKRFLMIEPHHNLDKTGSNEISILTQTFHYMMDEIRHSIEFRVRNEKMAVLGQLSAVLAHEIKNPLEPIKGSAEILKLKYPQNEDILKYSRIIQSEVSELIAFLDSFLDVAKSNNIRMKSISINKAVRETLLLLEYTLNKENIEVIMNLNDDRSAVNGDSGMIKQVILNLMLNAIQAKKGNKGKVEIQTYKNENRFHIYIKDYGQGIDSSLLSDIFLPFFTTKNEGTGIGLSTARHIVNKHKGEISIDSRLGLWTTVHIILPVSDRMDVYE